MSSDYDNPIIELEARLSDRPVSSLDAMQAIVKADGDLELASTRLNTKRANLLAAIVTDPGNHDTLSRYFRAFQTIRAFTLLGTITDYLEPKLDELNARDLAKIYIAMNDSLEKLTTLPAATNTQGNHAENMLKLLPPHVQLAIRSLIQDAESDADASA